MKDCFCCEILILVAVAILTILGCVVFDITPQLILNFWLVWIAFTLFGLGLAAIGLSYGRIQNKI